MARPIPVNGVGMELVQYVINIEFIIPVEGNRTCTFSCQSSHFYVKD